MTIAQNCAINYVQLTHKEEIAIQNTRTLDEMKNTRSSGKKLGAAQLMRSIALCMHCESWINVPL